MKAAKILLALLLSASTPLVFAANDRSQPEKSAPSPAPDSAWLAQAKAAYPLKTCVVSGEDLGGDMGEAIDHVYKQEGQPDRLVRFCCKMCLPKFKKEPVKYLKMIDDATPPAKAKKD